MFLVHQKEAQGFKGFLQLLLSLGMARVRPGVLTSARFPAKSGRARVQLSSCSHL